MVVETEQDLQGGVQFPTGGKVRERESAESVKLRYRQYSLDGRRYARLLCVFSRSECILRAIFYMR